MNRFNLTFSGEIVAGEDQEQVKRRFAAMFAIDDRARLDRFFSGETIILRRNLQRKEAAQFYHELQLLGAVAALVKVTTSDLADEVSKTPPPKVPVKVRAKALIRNTSNAAPTSNLKNNTDAAADIKSRKLAAQQRAAEEAARNQAAVESRQRKLAEEREREQAKAAENLRLAEEQRAQQAAEKARLAAEAEALKEEKRALKAAAKRKAAEEAALLKAQRIQKKAENAHRKEEEKARLKAELAEQKRLAAEEEALRKAELEEQKRQAAEEEARRKAELEEQKRLAAEEEARRKAELERVKRLAAEEEARRKAELEREKRLAAEEEARREAELEREKRLVAEKKARRKAALEEKKRLAAKKAAQAEHIKVAAQQLKEEAERKLAECQQPDAEMLAAQEQPPTVAPAEPLQRDTGQQPIAERAKQRSQKSAKARVKTTLNVPLRKRGQTPEVGTPGKRKRSSGAPNLYKLRPFRNSPEVRSRETHAQHRMDQAFKFGGIALAILLIAAGSLLQSTARPLITGASAVAINSNSEPLLLAGNSLLFHDRAGVGNTEVALDTLGVKSLQPPLAFDGEDALIALGRLSDDSANPATHDGPQLLRCILSLAMCEPLSPQLQDSRIEAFVLNPLDGSLLLADTAAAKLLKINSEGTVTASAEVAIADDAVLRLHGGLLWMNSTEGPAISVLRYEDNAFAQQLDEVLLLPPVGEQAATSRVSDFIWSGNSWWVTLFDPVSGKGALHRFDEDWNYLDTVNAGINTRPLQLLSWGQKTLVNDPRRPGIQRYNAEGMVEAPFESTLLQDLLIGSQQHARLTRLTLRGALLVSALAVMLCFGFGYLQSLRKLVYRPRREQGAEPLDEHAETLRWIEPAQSRQLQLRRTGMFYGFGALGTLLLAIALSVSVWQMAALMLVLCGPAIALLLLSRQPVGHIGVVGDRLLLVDHSGLYHLATGPRLQYRGPFLSIDDIVVFCGNRVLPAFSSAPLHQHINPPAMGGIRVDYKTIAIKLLECRHPLAIGALAILAAAMAAALLLLMQRIF